MEQNMTLNSTLSTDDKILYVERGGCFPWGVYCTPYCCYSFETTDESKKYRKELFTITYEIIEYFAKDKVVLIDCQYDKKKAAKRRLIKEWIHPEYVEDGKVNEFKQYLINSNRKDLIWDDYMRYVSDVINILLIPTEVRDYKRDIYILQECFDLELAKKAGECSVEDEKKQIGVKIYPHSKIVHKETDSHTIESYVNSKDYFIMIGITENLYAICIEPNPHYITYNQLLETIKPIIEKHGWKFDNTENPFIEGLQCDVNCLECDETECAYYLKGKNPRVDQTYYRVDID
ncbi:MAG: hypothetical protein E7483_05425 [Ruminococcaceae bacterium]|nr:hypothetical protein [Oscillospiraceae bacterium]